MVVGAFRGRAGKARGEVRRWGGEEGGRGGGVAEEAEVPDGIRGENKYKVEKGRPRALEMRVQWRSTVHRAV